MNMEPSQKIILKKSKILKAGRGVFAKQTIKKNELIERCPVIVFKGKEVQEMKKTTLKNYYFIWHKPKKIATKIALCLGFGSLYNHSYNPNATYKKELVRNYVDFKSIKEIKKGEEITINYNYGDPDDKTKLWIKSIKPAE